MLWDTRSSAQQWPTEHTTRCSSLGMSWEGSEFCEHPTSGMQMTPCQIAQTRVCTAPSDHIILYTAHTWSRYLRECLQRECELRVPQRGCSAGVYMTTTLGVCVTVDHQTK